MAARPIRVRRSRRSPSSRGSASRSRRRPSGGSATCTPTCARRAACTSTRTSTRTTGTATARSRRCATSTGSSATSTPTTGDFCRDPGPAARACSAGAASWPTPCTATTASCTGSPRPALRSRTARRRSSSSAAGRCRGGARSHRASNIAIGTDIGAGDEWLIPRVLNDCYKVHMSEPGADAEALHPAQLLFLGTLAGARALDQEALIGNLDAGKEADFVMVDACGPARLPDVARRGGRARRRIAPVHPADGHARGDPPGCSCAGSGCSRWSRWCPEAVTSSAEILRRDCNRTASQRVNPAVWTCPCSLAGDRTAGSPSEHRVHRAHRGRRAPRSRAPRPSRPRLAQVRERRCAAPSVPPVASTSSRISTREPGGRSPRCASIVAVPYSSAYSADAARPRQLARLADRHQADIRRDATPPRRARIRAPRCPPRRRTARERREQRVDRRAERRRIREQRREVAEHDAGFADSPGSPRSATAPAPSAVGSIHAGHPSEAGRAIRSQWLTGNAKGSCKRLQ